MPPRPSPCWRCWCGKMRPPACPLRIERVGRNTMRFVVVTVLAGIMLAPFASAQKLELKFDAAAMASNFNSSFCALANGASMIPASTVTTTNLMVFLPTLSIRRGQAGGRIFPHQQRQHGEGRGGIGHELGLHGAGFVLLVHGDGLPAAAFRVLV